MATTLLRRALSTVTDRRTLWVCYADTGTVRRRLASLAQQVRRALDDEYLPQLVLPRGERVRHGFWFMRFESEEAARAARAALRDRTFETECGTLRGALAMATGTRGGDVRAALRLDGAPTAASEAWVAERCAEHGALERVEIPRLHCNWDPGWAFATFTSEEAAEAARVALDGAPSREAGCNLLVRHRTQRPLRDAVPIDGRRARTPPRSPAGGSASAPSAAPERTLWVSYADEATVRRRLTAVAQQVRALLTAGGGDCERLVLPRGERVRHGFWFMRFGSEAEVDAARASLDGQPFVSECGTLRGTLALHAGTRAGDVRAMVRTAARNFRRAIFGAQFSARNSAQLFRVPPANPISGAPRRVGRGRGGGVGSGEVRRARRDRARRCAAARVQLGPGVGVRHVRERGGGRGGARLARRHAGTRRRLQSLRRVRGDSRGGGRRGGRRGGGGRLAL